MLATRLYSVIKGSCQAFFLEQLDLRENILISLGWSYTLMQVQPKQGTGLCKSPFMRPRKMYAAPAKNGQQSIVKNKHKSHRTLERQLSAPSPALSPFPLLFFLPYDSIFLPVPKGSHFPFSHFTIYKRHHHAEHTAGLFVGDSLSLLVFSCRPFIQLHRTMGFRGYTFNWTYKDGQSFCQLIHSKTVKE